MMTAPSARGNAFFVREADRLRNQYSIQRTRNSSCKSSIEMGGSVRLAWLAAGLRNFEFRRLLPDDRHIALMQAI